MSLYCFSIAATRLCPVRHPGQVQTSLARSQENRVGVPLAGFQPLQRLGPRDQHHQGHEGHHEVLEGERGQRRGVPEGKLCQPSRCVTTYVVLKCGELFGSVLSFQF